MLILRRIEKAIEYQQELIISFSDVKSAFDELSRDSVENVLTDAGESIDMVERIMDVLTDTVAYVKTNQGNSKIFETTGGAPQGSSLSPLIFIGPLGIATREVHRRYPLPHGEYADDLYHVLNNMDNWPKLMVALQEALAKIGLRLEMAKTDVLRVTDIGEIEIYHWNQDSKISNLTEDANPEDLLLKDPKATSLRYLGSQIGSAKKAVQSRIAQANSSFNQLHAAVWMLW